MKLPRNSITKDYFSICTGRDGTKAFVTGKFTEKGLIDDISGLTPEQIQELEDWLKFYIDHKDYKYVGKLYVYILGGSKQNKCFKTILKTCYACTHVI